ncbi:hypothetical protein [Butyrivibrio sp. MC2013]|uniref:hypothetical protein n=1 Tax=Butyrivibrio sp. MC2013 TaxID=1280686 RepID=UPI000427F948|nr:hypothetical protein [Butyrivibrio sp. MC2013]
MDQRNTLVLCDTDEKYIFRLDEYLRNNLTIPFTICDYTDTDNLQEAPDELVNNAALLIISESAYKNCTRCPFDRILILEEDGDDSGKYDICTEGVYMTGTGKYQSMDALVRKILAISLEHTDTICGGAARDGRLELICAYSPVKRSGQSSFVHGLAAHLGREKKTLVMSLETFAGDLEVDNTDRDLQDILYFFENDPGRLGLYLQRAVKHMGSYDYLLPARSFLAVKGVAPEEWIRLIEAIDKDTDYDNLIIDLSEITEAFTLILDRADHVFTANIDDPVQTAKMSAYTRAMRLTGHGEVIDKTMVYEYPLSDPAAGGEAFAAAVWNMSGERMSKDALSS